MENNEINNNVEVPKDIKKNNKKGLIIIIAAIILIIGGVLLILLLPGKDSGAGNTEKDEKLKPLPLPEVTGGERGQLGIDKNINESNIDEYLNRSDSVYRDMRMLDDPAQYENIGGDRFLSGYVKGFEIVSLPYLIPVEGLPEVVGNTYSGKTLFSVDENGNYIPNYEESLSIIEELFPKDKVIFLMCGGGGYAGMTKAFLVSLGWDETKIYNIGGYWYYDGENDVKVPKVNGEYDFSGVPYHEIKFDELKEKEGDVIVSPQTPTPTPTATVTQEPTSNVKIYLDDKYYGSYEGGIDKGIESLSLFSYKDRYTALAGTDEGVELEKEIDNVAAEYGNKINQMLDNKESFVILVNASDFCASYTSDSVTLETNIIELARENNFYFYNIGLKIYKNTRLYQQVKYAPSVIIINKGEILAYTDAESDADLKLSKSREEFNNWFTSHVYLNK